MDTQGQIKILLETLGLKSPEGEDMRDGILVDTAASSFDNDAVETAMEVVVGGHTIVGGVDAGTDVAHQIVSVLVSLLPWSPASSSTP